MNRLWALAGGIFLVIGAIGVVVPIWPTTVFWILAALCFARSHPPARDWIYSRPGIGRQIETFVEHGLLSWRAKVSAIAGMALGGAVCALLLWHAPVWLAVSLGVLSLSALFVATRPTDRNTPRPPTQD